MEVLFTARFLRSYNKLPRDVQSDVEQAVELFKDRGNHDRLKLYKLRGKMKQHYAFSANYSYRIVVKISGKVVTYMDVGDHSVYE